MFNSQVPGLMIKYLEKARAHIRMETVSLVSGSTERSMEWVSLPCMVGQISHISEYPQCAGTLYLSSGDKYQGDWKDGKRQGNGTYYYR